MEKRWIWPFELEEQIGSGAMGVVYRARFVKNDRRVALKLLPADVAANAILAARFQREMELLKDLRHPNIVHCFGGTCEGDQWFYAMELVEGGTVASLLMEQGKLSWRQAVEFGLQVCAALEHAHERGIIHRDLKPGNLLLSKTGKLKLSDFGLAQMAAETKLTAAGKTVGSLHYMAPEQIQGKPPVSHRSDLYALGCVLFELLTGRPPFIGGAMAEILQRHIRESPPSVSSMAFDCPPQLEGLIAELLQKDPARRPQNAATVARRLHDIDQSVTIKLPRHDRNRPTAPGPADTVTADVPRDLRAPSRWLVGAFAGTLALSGALAIALYRQGPSQRAENLLLAAVAHPEPEVRKFAVRTLGDLGPEARGAVPQLLELLQSPDPALRAEAARAVGRIGTGDSAVLAPLTKAQKVDEAPQVRSAAAEAVEQLRKSSGGFSFSYVIAGLVAVLAAGGFWVWKKVSV